MASDFVERIASFDGVWAEQAYHMGTVRLMLWQNIRHLGKIGVIRHIEVEEIADDAAVAFPGNDIHITREASVRLMDALWAAGVRPSIFKAGDDTLQAQREHIADLRAISSKALEMAGLLAFSAQEHSGDTRE